MNPSVTADIILWGNTIGAVSWDAERELALFEYASDFLESGIELAPLTMPLRAQVYSFPELPRESFHGLPGMLADALPDRFGNLLIDEWLVRTGRKQADFTPVERLCYIGRRGMGALEFRPAIRDRQSGSVPVNVAELVDLANTALAEKEMLATQINGKSEDDLDAMRDILRVGTSAGGARAKAVIAWNDKTGDVRSGQVKAPPGFGYWLIKFDGVAGNRDKELNDPQGFGKIEYTYHRMALAAGIEMSECRLFEENGRCHFMTRRFDRTAEGNKIFMQSLCGIAHMDFNQAGAYGYEQAMDVALRLGLDAEALRQLFRRMVFNLMARNQDDHTKNIAFLMNKSGDWSLAPAYDITYCYNPNGAWTRRHQMSVNGKHDHFERDDFMAVAKRFNLFKKAGVDQVLEETADALRRWPEFAAQTGVPEQTVRQIAAHHRHIA
ncbi:type II toxin-antitoxin system HipA family toxin [Tichowtungia aerotolerans]|uniref:Type II toxin-antitoxin system HipA family toxin n=1 Tax=Tichowtungia aerotolerans TaxID=2697043 RepID=A0A6P1M293_9BACT|nr:type II toxin-antitoxin system HipA family toxin [Tichowtungia aerotolerans]QHI68949.1 type II toxin-antitoxin system HipA family toxin [Tichowtungia aerotolerans]